MTEVKSKLPPQNLEAEVSVLGGILIDNEAISRVIEILRSEDFYKPAHQKIYKTILQLYEKNEPADLLTVTNILRTGGELESIGGAMYLATLVDQVSTSAHIGSYSKIIREKSILRSLIDGATDIVQKGYGEEGDVDEYLDQAEKIIFEIASRQIKQGFTPIKGIVKSSFKTIEELYEKKELVTGVATGFQDLDRMTS
ncbi:MAG: DnaB-like helicase N-terminal domain-containing protein, partial [Deltaproteobacteria bacterium]|nr:DnaB-like helicase N-terminal domain-containing protein [Deltaproteobacteria bacterium]